MQQYFNDDCPRVAGSVPPNVVKMTLKYYKTVPKSPQMLQKVIPLGAWDTLLNPARPGFPIMSPNGVSRVAQRILCESKGRPERAQEYKKSDQK